MPTKVTIIGAGSVVFSLGLVKDMCLTEGLGGSTVCFMDINDERLDTVYRLAVRYAEDLGADLTFERTLDRGISLQDADFVINTATVTHNEHFMKRRRELTAEYGYFTARVRIRIGNGVRSVRPGFLWPSLCRKIFSAKCAGCMNQQYRK